MKGKNGRPGTKIAETCAKNNEPKVLATGLRHPADSVEQFLGHLDGTFLTLALHSEHKNNRMDSTIKQRMKALSSSSSVVIPTAKQSPTD